MRPPFRNPFTRATPFSAGHFAAIRDTVALEDLIEATRFNVNAVNLDDRLVMASASLDSWHGWRSVAIARSTSTSSRS